MNKQRACSRHDDVRRGIYEWTWSLFNHKCYDDDDGCEAKEFVENSFQLHEAICRLIRQINCD